MDLLVTASIGIYEREKGRYFLQIITADKYLFYHVEIGSVEAYRLSQLESIEISRDTDHASGSRELAQNR